MAPQQAPFRTQITALSNQDPDSTPDLNVCWFSMRDSGWRRAHLILVRKSDSHLAC